jgi:hypothetical protein
MRPPKGQALHTRAPPLWRGGTLSSKAGRAISSTGAGLPALNVLAPVSCHISPRQTLGVIPRRQLVPLLFLSRIARLVSPPPHAGATARQTGAHTAQGGEGARRRGRKEERGDGKMDMGEREGHEREAQ